MNECTVRGKAPENPRSAPAPTDRKLPDGQHADHWVLCEGEREKGYVRPLRMRYEHIGLAPPSNPLRELTPDETERYRQYEYVKFEAFPKSESPVTGRFWTQAALDKIGKGCGVVTTMPLACAETYARKPDFYGSTFCCGCGKYLPVGADGEFVWDGTDERVGT